MSPRRCLLLAAVLAVSGCGASGRSVEVGDRVAARNAFIDVVRECYRERKDGTLLAPTVDTDRTRMVFRYDKEVDGAESEWIDLTFAGPSTSSKSGEPRNLARVLVYQPVYGPNRVLKEQTSLIEAKLRERAGPPPKK